MSQAKQSIPQKLKEVEAANLRCARIILEKAKQSGEHGIRVDWAKRILAASVDGKTAA